MRQFRKSLTNCIGRYFSRCRFVKRRFFKNNRMILNCSFDVVQVIALFMTVEFIASFTSVQFIALSRSVQLIALHNFKKSC